MANNSFDSISFASIAVFSVKIKRAPLRNQGLRMNGEHNSGEEGVIVRTASAFSGEADFYRVLLEYVERNMPNDGHVFCGVIFPSAVIVLAKGHIQAPVKGILYAPVSPNSLGGCVQSFL